MKLKERIKRVLEDRPTLRDSDELLINWVLIDLGCMPAQWTLFDYLHSVKSKELPSFDTITRLGRLIKKENPHLRGKEYILRQTKKQEKAKKDMGYDHEAVEMVKSSYLFKEIVKIVKD